MDDILNINNVYSDSMVRQIYPSELQLNKANTSDTEAAFVDLHLSISNDIASTKIYDKRDDFDFEIVNFPFLDGDVPRTTSYGVYISQLIRFARASSHVANTRNRKYHNHKSQTTPWHREEEPLNHHETPGRQNKQSNQLSLPHQDDCNTRTDIK